jgi:hypothetical protein
MQWKESRNKSKNKRIGNSASSEELQLKKVWGRASFCHCNTVQKKNKVK